MNLFSALTLLMLFHYSAEASEPIKFTAGPKKTHLIELFSTQSCSSCPPAQAWISKLKSHPQLWNQFIPLVFHVDYWDYLGWQDPYSEKKYSQRQRAYVRQWASKTAYTPMFVFDGEEVRISSILRDLKKESPKVGTLNSQRVSKLLYRVSFQPTQSLDKVVTLHTSIVGIDISTKVTAGENSGTTLHHDFLSLWSHKVNMKKNNNIYVTQLTIDATKVKDAPSYGIIFWVTYNNSLTPIQATGGPIKRSQL